MTNLLFVQAEFALANLASDCQLSKSRRSAAYGAPGLIACLDLQVQFFAKGPSGNARVSAEMYQDDSKQWQYAFLYMDLEYPVPTRVTLIEPRYY